MLLFNLLDKNIYVFINIQMKGHLKDKIIIKGKRILYKIDSNIYLTQSIRFS